jgi:hypothetical protein
MGVNKHAVSRRVAKKNGIRKAGYSAHGIRNIAQKLAGVRAPNDTAYGLRTIFSRSLCPSGNSKKLPVKVGLGLSRSLLSGFSASMLFTGKLPNQAESTIREKNGDRLQEALGKFQLDPCRYLSE